MWRSRSTRGVPLSVGSPGQGSLRVRQIVDSSMGLPRAPYVHMVKIGLVASAVLLALGIVGAPATATAHSALAPLPKHFPTPPHSVVIREHFKGRNDSYELRVATMSSAMRFWVRALPKHGWTISSAHLKGSPKFIFFHGHGYGKGKYTGKNINRTMINTLDPHSHHVVVVFHRSK
jgi:hypothetical protein